MPNLRWVVWIVLGLIATTDLASAQASIFKTKRSASSVILPLVVGVGFEYETNSDQTQYDFPLLLQDSFSETFQATVETSLTHIEAKTEDVTTVTGLDDVETSLEYEFLRERRYRPALTVLGGAKWPTATDSDLGSPGTDCFVGLIASKEFDTFEVDFNAIFTSSGNPDQQDILEVPVAVQVPINHFFALAAEIAPTFDEGGGGESGAQTEYTVGAIWQATLFSTLEAGVVARDDGTWQLVFGWEYSFAGEN